jgi:hypothetical protein
MLLATKIAPGELIAAARRYGAPIEVALASSAVAVGISVYLLDRGGAVAFVPSAWAAALPVRHVFGSLSGSLPTFLHTFAFALFFVALLRPRAVAAVAILCGSWTLLEAVFEIGQLPRVGASLASWAGAARDLEPVRDVLGYFTSGTFASADLASIVIGGTLAFVVAAVLRPGET